MIAPFLARPIIVLGLLALAVGPASTLVNLRRAEFSAETMVHGVFPGIVVGMAVGGREAIIPGGAVCAAFVAAALTVASRKQRHSEATTAVLLTAFFSLGIVISLRIGDMSGQLESLMFGRLLDITLSRMATSALVLVVAAELLAATWRAQVAVAFDREAARVSGIPVTWIGRGLHGGRRPPRRRIPHRSRSLRSAARGGPALHGAPVRRLCARWRMGGLRRLPLARTAPAVPAGVRRHGGPPLLCCRTGAARDPGPTRVHGRRRA